MTTMDGVLAYFDIFTGFWTSASEDLSLLSLGSSLTPRFRASSNVQGCVWFMICSGNSRDRTSKNVLSIFCFCMSFLR